MVDSLSKCVLDAPTPLHPDLLGTDGAATTSRRDSGRPCFPCLFPHMATRGRQSTPAAAHAWLPQPVTGMDHRNLCSDSHLPSDLTPSSRRSNYTALLAFPEHDRHTASSEVFFGWWGGDFSFFKKLRLNSHHIKLTILGCRIQWHLVHSRYSFLNNDLVIISYRKEWQWELCMF